MEKKELTTAPTRRRRPRNRRRRQQKRKEEEQPNNVKAKDLDLSDLISEASALEKQLSELQKQLKINHENMPAKEQGKRATMIANEQIIATEEEMGYVRNSLKKTYRRLFDQDFLYATSHRIEDKIWRYIFYAEIETVRSKLRQLKPDHPDYQTVQKSFSQKIESALKFYRELNNKVKSTFEVNTQTFGIELFKLLSEDKIVGVLLQSNYICMGDLARYHAQQAMLIKNTEQATYYWSLSKSCYSKAVDVYRVSGKPYSQLALVSMSKGSAIDVVWYYCMSLAVKYPSTVGRDNLFSFYSKIRLNPVLKNTTDFNTIISQFVQAFLYLHKTLMFNEGDEIDAKTVSEQLSLALANASKSQDFNILRTTLSRTVNILIVSIWITSERMKDKANFSQRSVIQSCQIKMYIFVFHLFTHIYRQASSESGSDKLDKSIAEAVLPSLSVWATFLSYNIITISQYCSTAMMDVRNREPEKKELAKAIQALLPILIAHPCFPDPVLNVLPTTYPLSEDISLLGCVPFTQFHMQVDYFKEQPYQVEGEHTFEARKQVRWGRIREWIKKMADSNSFEFIQYNQAEQKYSIIDENAKRQQQNRFMKALATQRLMEQVSSLEKNVNRMTLNNKQKEKTKKDIYTCVMDVTCFLDGLHKVKKWSTQTLDVNSRTQGSILEVVVPLEALDDLDDCKKGSSHMNRQARESIRYLDQVLGGRDHPQVDYTTSFLRFQKMEEKLDNWEQAKAFWIGEESRPNNMDELMTDDEEEENDDDSSLTDPSESDLESDLESDSNSDTDLFKPRRYRRDEDSDLEDSSQEESEQDESDISEEDEENDGETSQQKANQEEETQDQIEEEYTYDEEGNYGEVDEEYDEDVPAKYTDVPKAYRPIIGCALYYYQKKIETPDRIVLVTNDEDLAWWAEMFGNVNTGKRLIIKTVDEWDRIVNNFSQTYAYDPNKR